MTELDKLYEQLKEALQDLSDAMALSRRRSLRVDEILLEINRLKEGAE